MRKNLRLKSLCLCFFVFVSFCKAQTISLTGSVNGFSGDKVLMLKKASKNVSFEGPLSGTKIIAECDGNKISSQTDISGSYKLFLPKPGKYTVSAFKDSYSTVVWILNYSSAGAKIAFSNISFILKKDDNSLNTIGELNLDGSSNIKAIAYDENQKKSSADVMHSNKNLLLKSAQINNSTIGQVKSEEVKTEIVVAKDEDTLAKSISKKIRSAMKLALSNADLSTDELRQKIDEASTLMKGIDVSSSEYLALKEQISHAEMQLKMQEQLIDLQKRDLDASRKIIMYLILFAVAVLLAFLTLILLFRQRKKYNAELEKKNTEITKVNTRILSSIKYASVIQSNFLENKNDLKEYFKNSFVFNKPKDYLSGDFYWLSNVNGNKIVVLADCTGHGVPGALLTILGHNLLNEIVNMKGEVMPNKILLDLNEGITSAFSSHDKVQYGMDITVLCFKDSSNEVLFSGLANGLYHFQNGTLKHHVVSNKTIGTELKLEDLENKSLEVKQGDCFFLMSDGFSDQFGIHNNKTEKLNIKRTENILQSISNFSNFSEAEGLLGKELEAWKGKLAQTDDILVLGFKV